MSSDWLDISLGECLAKVVDNRGKTPPISETMTSNPLIEVNAIVGQNKYPNFGLIKKYVSDDTYNAWFRAGHPMPGDVIFSTVGSIAEIALFPGGNGCIAQNLVGLRPNTEVLTPEFLYYSLANPAMQIRLQTLDISSVQPSIKVPHLLATRLRLPAISVQHALVATLSSLDDRITLLRETNTTLEAIAQALFKSWFVDFDPVHAKMQGRAPEGMDQATAALFPDSLEESELGAVPKGWKVGVLGDIAKTVKKQLSPADLHLGLNYVGLEHMPRKSLSLVDWDDASGLESAKAAFSHGDVLFGKLRPYFHKVVIAPFDGVCSTDILVCQPTKPSYRGITAQHLFSDELVSYADRLSNGAKMPRVNWGDLADHQIVLPAEVVSDAFSKAVDPLIDRITHNVHEAKTLACLRDALLPRLISGRVNLKIKKLSRLVES